MRTNTLKAKYPNRTHEGAPAPRISAEKELRRTVSACLLWEDSFYENGQSVADRIATLVPQVSAEAVSAIAIHARTELKLRHVPLLLVALMTKLPHKRLVAKTLAAVIQRADELCEFLALYHSPVIDSRTESAQVKRGLAEAFRRFNAYQLAKYNREGAWTLRDVLFICHAKPENELQDDTWKQLIDGTLASPDTWEVALSAGEKREAWERLLAENKLGYLALLRNLRNMHEAGVPQQLVDAAILARRGAEWVLPFRFTAAARACPKHEPALDAALGASIQEMQPLTGNTIVLVDVSGSMDDKLSAKSDLTRLDAAATLASIIPGPLRVFTFSNALVEVPPRKGMAGVDAIVNSQPHSGTQLGAAVQTINQFDHDRLIVITDEQSHDRVPGPRAKHAYMINVAAYKNGVGYGPWTHIDGFSESVLSFIRATEK